MGKILKGLRAKLTEKRLGRSLELALRDYEARDLTILDQVEALGGAAAGIYPSIVQLWREKLGFPARDRGRRGMM